ncbi:MAG: S8 family serine peptidase [Methanospirillum sp.]|nr:S8 family serine peptidase [Methanospirillum sp.]
MQSRIIIYLLAAAALLAALGACPAMASPDDVTSGPGGEYAAHRLIVTFSPVAVDRADLVLLAHTGAGAVVSRDLGPLGLPGRQVVTLPDGADLEEAVARYRADPSVLRVERDWVVRLDRTPNDPGYASLWGLPKIAAPAAWDRTTGGTGVVVAVIDTGVDAAHPDLAPNVWTNPGEVPGNGLDDDANGYVDDVHGWDFRNGDPVPDDAYGHGTHCAGTIGAAGDNGIGIAGAAWTVRVMPLKYMQGNDCGFVSIAAEAILYANRMGADVISCSWYEPESPLIRDAIAASPALVVCSAGNEGRDTDATPQYPACYPLDQVISVAATDPADAMAPFSNYGATSVDLGAPGVSIYSAMPGGGYGWMSGTSMAAPHVAGVAALALSLDPSLSTAELRRALLEGADPVASLAGRSVSGGRLNASRTLALAAPPVPAVPPSTLSPTDTDTDGLYDDVNGNGREDFADVVLYFNQMTWIAGNEPVAAFDYNENGRIDFADVTWLFNNL